MKSGNRESEKEKTGNSVSRFPAFPPSALPAQPEFTFSAPVITPMGDGSYRVAPGRPEPVDVEISTREAADILEVSRAQMFYLRESKLGQQHLRWRFTTELRGKIVWQKQSVLAYKEATRLIGK